MPENETQSSIQSARPTFYQDALARSAQFGKDLLVLIPEMESIAIVPIWTVPQERILEGLLIGRNSRLQQPAEIMRMAVQLHGCLRQVTELAEDKLREVDQIMLAMAKEIRVKQQQLAELDQRLAAATGEQHAAGGAAPTGA